MAQTADGYIWLGTEFGLLRFDGVRSVPWQPPAGSSLPNARIRALHVARDGTLWIGTMEGLLFWRDGRLTSLPRFARSAINALAEDRAGTMWVTLMDLPTTARLCAIRKDEATCEGDNETFGNWVASVHVDSKDRVWLTSGVGLWQWHPTPRRLHPLPENAGGTLQGLAEGTMTAC